MLRSRIIDTITTLGCLAALIGTGWLLGVVIGHPDFERSITDSFVDHRTAVLDDIAPWVTDLASPAIYLPVIVATIGVLRLRGTREPKVLTTPVLALVGARIISHFVKDLVGKARPAASLQLVAERAPAFPSGHAITAMAVWGAAALLLGTIASGRLRLAINLIGALVILGVGLSRVYLGVHWATDVLFGWALGAAWLAVLLRRIEWSTSNGRAGVG